LHREARFFCRLRPCGEAKQLLELRVVLEDERQNLFVVAGRLHR